MKAMVDFIHQFIGQESLGRHHEAMPLEEQGVKGFTIFLWNVRSVRRIFSSMAGLRLLLGSRHAQGKSHTYGNFLREGNVEAAGIDELRVNELGVVASPQQEGGPVHHRVFQKPILEGLRYIALVKYGLECRMKLGHG